MTLLDKLPLIRGWTWRVERLTQTVNLSQEVMIYNPPTPSKEIGWIIGIDFVGDDAYLGLRLVMPGLDTGYGTFFALFTLGAQLPPPSGAYLGRYWQPNPLRTIGIFSSAVITSAYPYPFYGAVRLYLSLRTGTTEASATGAVAIHQIIIEDRNLFLTDLRKVLYGRWAPLMDFIGHIPLLRRFVVSFEKLGIPFKEQEIIEPPGIAR